MPHEHSYFVYILASRSRQLYIGVTGRLEARIRKHKALIPDTYTARYITRLVYYEQTQYVLNALAREVQMKKWTRAKKVALIESVNPTWEDLSERFGAVVTYHGEDREKVQKQATTEADSSLRSE